MNRTQSDRANPPPETFFCPECGYDLRGQVGDVSCCPECGFQYDVPALKQILRIPRHRRSGWAYSLADAATASVVALIIAIGSMLDTPDGTAHDNPLPGLFVVIGLCILPSVRERMLVWIHSPPQRRVTLIQALRGYGAQGWSIHYVVFGLGAIPILGLSVHPDTVMILPSLSVGVAAVLTMVPILQSACSSNSFGATQSHDETMMRFSKSQRLAVAMLGLAVFFWVVLMLIRT
jgi:hypothetical protein